MNPYMISVYLLDFFGIYFAQKNSPGRLEVCPANPIALNPLRPSVPQYQLRS